MVQIGCDRRLRSFAIASQRRLDRMIRDESSMCMLMRPSGVKTDPFRASRVGSTQSNMSIPWATPFQRSSGEPTPMRYRGLSTGSSGMTMSIISAISALVSPTLRPPMAIPIHPRPRQTPRSTFEGRLPYRPERYRKARRAVGGRISASRRNAPLEPAMRAQRRIVDLACLPGAPTR